MPGTTPMPHVLDKVREEMIHHHPTLAGLGGPQVAPALVRPSLAARHVAAEPAPRQRRGASPKDAPEYRFVSKREARKMLINLGFHEELLGTEHEPKFPRTAHDALKVRGVKIRPKKRTAKSKVVAAEKKAKKIVAKAKKTAKKVKTAAKKTAKKVKTAAKKTAKKVVKKAAKKVKAAKKPAAKKSAKRKTAAKKVVKKAAKKVKAAKKPAAKKSAVKATQTVSMAEARKAVKAAGGTLPKTGITREQRAALKAQGVTVKRAAKK